MRAVLSLIFCLITGVAWGDEGKLSFVAPGVLPGVITDMRSPGFWIARHPAPDESVLTLRGIAALNRRIVGEGLVENLAKVPRILPGKKVRAELSGIIDGLKQKTLFGPDGKVVSADFIAGFEREIFAIPEKVEVLYGFIIKPAALRLLPMDGPLYGEPGDVDFDELQNSGLDIGTPVIVLAHSRDRQWLFVHDAISAGWVLAKSVGRASYDVFIRRVETARPLVITSARTDLFLDKEMTEFLTTARMGARFSYKSVSAGFWEIEVSAVDPAGQVKFSPAYVPKNNASAGYLSYTPRVIYEQAFKLLDAPYGWGDMNGGQDCSRFMQMVFATVGIQLPRNSGEQARAGDLPGGFKDALSKDEKAALIVAKGLGAATLLRLKGHIMLYLGAYNDQPYAIHSVWGYREPMTDNTQRLRVIGRVAVTSLDLGIGSEKKSLLERIVSLRILK